MDPVAATVEADDGRAASGIPEQQTADEAADSGSGDNARKQSARESPGGAWRKVTAMGFMDKVKGMLGQHGDKVQQGLDKAAQTADSKTKGKYSDQIKSGTQKAKDATGKLSDSGKDGGESGGEGKGGESGGEGKGGGSGSSS